MRLISGQDWQTAANACVEASGEFVSRKTCDTHELIIEVSGKRLGMTCDGESFLRSARNAHGLSQRRS